MRQPNETFIFLACWEDKHEKKFLLIGYIPSLLDCFFITKKLQRVLSSTLHFAWQFSCKWNRRHAILPQTQICKFGRTKFNTHTLSYRGPDLFVYTSSSIAFFLMQWEKSTVIFPTHFNCVWLRTCSTISSWLERIRNLLVCCRIQQKIHETYKICSWLEHKRSSHKEFVYLL